VENNVLGVANFVVNGENKAAGGRVFVKGSTLKVPFGKVKLEGGRGENRGRNPWSMIAE
jgi:hypothetical protein